MSDDMDAPEVIIMEVRTEEIKVPSSDGKNTLAGIVYLPPEDVPPKGFFQVVHGMCEHIGRYSRFMTDIAAEGMICFGFDNLGHGKTAEKEDLGFIAEKDGWDCLAKDIAATSGAVREKHGNGTDLPYYLLGHSMGSFIARLASERYVTPDRLIAIGTGGSIPASGAIIAFIEANAAVFGKRHHSKTVDLAAFSSYNKRFGGGTPEDPAKWLTSLPEERVKNYTDESCRVKFTVSAMSDLMKLIRKTNRSEWFANIAKRKIPVLLASGEDDPVGNYGSGVREVEKRLKKAGSDVRCVIYPNARHEILNDFTYSEAKAEILGFCIG
ncbi:MAG: alpha/beta fold hydrolase [Clostridia bacterium]|nr:alpha/beta fold hydrolase [Clostridia bacterium]